MKIILIFLSISISMMFYNNHPKQPRQSMLIYTLKDTVQYDCQIFSAHTVSLYCNAKKIDNIDLAPGLLYIGEGSIIYRRINFTPNSDDTPQGGMISGCIDKYYLFDGQQKKEINTFLPDFNDWLSSLTVIDGIAYYWGLRDVDDTTTIISAVKYDFKRAKSSSIFLSSQWLATDNPAALDFPTKNDSLIVYNGFRNTWLVNFDLNTKSRITNE